MGDSAAMPSSELAVGTNPAVAAAATATQSSDAICCVCLEEVDYNGSVLVQCTKCAIHVHVRCYGLTVATDGAPWLCEACQYVVGKLPASTPADDTVPRMQPRCAVCPIEGGALRLTNQPGVWCHVLCINWIPELSHSVSGTMNEAVNIGLLDRSRESLRCLVCGQRGGCIQCVSGRCARAFHVLCAIRAPSSLLFTGYNAANRQVYHCKAHLSDVETASRYEMNDRSWRAMPRVQQFVGAHPHVDGKCRVCQAKTVAATADAHEAQCLLAWLTREDIKWRRDEMARRGLKPIAIAYAVATRGKAAAVNGSQSAKYKGTSGTASKKRQHAAVQQCPECGAAVRASQLASHVKSGCTYGTGTSDGDSSSSSRPPRSKNPKKLKRRASSSDVVGAAGADGLAVDEQVSAADLSDVLFATWPGQSAGSPMDSTHLWRTVHSAFCSSKALMKRRMDPLVRTLCGAKLEDIGNLARKPARHDLLECVDTVLLDRVAGDATDALHLKAVLHRCDFMMRASRLRCPDDVHMRPDVQIRYTGDSAAVTDSSALATSALDDGVSRTIRVQFASDSCAPIGCVYTMHVAKRGRSAPTSAADGDSAIWSSFRHDTPSILAGTVVEAHKLPLGRDDHLWLSMALDSSTETDATDSVESNDSVVAAFDATRPDELTPEISLLVATLREQMKQNRFRLRALSKKLQLADHVEAQRERATRSTEAYYKEFAAWKRLCKSLAVGYRDIREPLVVQTSSQSPPTPTTELKKTRHHAAHGANGSSSLDEDDIDMVETDAEPIDDGTCVVCFDGQSPESNPIVFCDRCDLAVHQGCYGIVELPSSEFYCDRCSVETAASNSSRDDPRATVFCQLCSLRDGAFKRTVDGKWVHVVCALWCPKVWIANLADLSAIHLVAAAPSSPRFVDTTAEVATQLAAAASPTESLVPAAAASAAGGSTVSATAEAPPPLKQGSLCLHCRVACGRTIECSHAGCTTSFHPLCGWFEGLPMTIQLRDDKSFVYAGGGAGLRFTMFCGAHLPSHYSSAERVTQRRRRSKFRIDAFYVAQHSVSASRNARTSLRARSPRHSAAASSSLLAGPIVQALMAAADSKQAAAAASDNDSDASYEWIDRAPCGACFQYISPIVASPAAAAVATNVDALHKRQFLMRCQYCSTFVHPECCLSDTGRPSTIVQSNWICERCTLVGEGAPTPCIVCNTTSDYLMPCSNPPGTAAAKTLSATKTLSAAKTSAAVSTDASAPFDKWVHVFCCKWTKAKTVRKNRMLYAHTPNVATDGAAVRCELCSRKGRNLVQCQQCPKRFHAICAAKKRLFIAKSGRQDWRFYCEAHPPGDAVYDVTHQAWLTAEILAQLQDLRRSLERGRMLLEMARQRDRQQKRLLNVCTLPFMEASLDVVLKKRPTPAMRDAYLLITGEVLTDTPRRRIVQQSPAKRPAAAPTKARTKAARRSSSTDNEDDDTIDSDNETPPPPRRSTRGASASAAVETVASSALRTRKRLASTTSSTAATDTSKRRRVELKLELEPESSPSGDSSVETEAEAPRRRASTRRKLDTSVEAEANESRLRTNRGGGMSPNELQRRFLRCLEAATVASDFDVVVAETYPELVD